tara:strand:+ start:569 stop:2443 length:1875 start_codon:yes stop_codon:yes gene_type:complete
MYRLKLILLLGFLSSGLAQNWLQNQRTERQFKEAVSSYNDGRFAIAEEISSKIIDLNNEGFNEKTLLLLLKSQVALNKSSAAKITAKRLFTDYPVSSFLPFIMESMGDLYVNSSNYESAYRMYSRAKQSNDNKDFDIKIDKKLLKLIKIKLPQALLDELLVFESNPSAVNIHLLAIAFSQIMDGLPDAAALTLGKIDPTMLSNEFSDLMESLLRESYKPSSPVLTIGLAVPLSGDDSDMGNYFLKGFEKGQNSNSFNNQRLSILAKDTKSDNIETIKVVNELKSVDQLMGIISPLDNAESISLLSSLNNSDIPVLLTNRHETEVKKINQNAFLLSSSYTVEGRIAAQYIVKHLGLDSIAVVAPANKKTEIQIDAFINEVNRLGGNVVATEWYTGEPKNLRRQFKYLRKVAFELEEKKKTFDVALGMDLDSLDALFDVSADDFFDLPKPDKKSMSSNDSSKVVLKTIQAIYLPINHQDLEYIGPQIPMYNFETKIIGNASWQQLEILTKENIGPHVRGMSIISNLYITDIDTFEISFENYYQYQLGNLTSEFLTSLSLNDMSRSSFKNSLQEIEMYEGKGFNYYPLESNNKINSAFQLINFNGNSFQKAGVLALDTLIVVQKTNP